MESFNFAFNVISSVLGAVFLIIIQTPLFCVLVAAGLLLIGICLFHKTRRAARAGGRCRPFKGPKLKKICL